VFSHKVELFWFKNIIHGPGDHRVKRDGDATGAKLLSLRMVSKGRKGHDRRRGIAR